MQLEVPIDDYDDMTVEDVKAAVRDGDYSTGEVQRILEYEYDHKDRVTLTDWLEGRLEDGGDNPEAETPPAADVDADPEGRWRHLGWPGPEVDDPELPPEHPTNLPDPGEHIAVTNPETGYIAGMFFEELWEVRSVPMNARIRDALDDDRLQRVRPRGGR